MTSDANCQKLIDDIRDGRWPASQELVNSLLVLGSSPNGSDLGIAKSLLERGASPNATDKEGRTPLHMAAENKLLSLYVLLVDFGADPHQKDNLGRTARSMIDDDVAALSARYTESAPKMEHSIGAPGGSPALRDGRTSNLHARIGSLLRSPEGVQDRNKPKP